jgi:hypothetical protein
MYWKKALLWYIQDANAAGFSPKEWKSASAPQGDDLKQREDEIAQKEQDLVAKEAEQKKFADQLAEKEKKLNELQKPATKPGPEKSAGKAQANLQRQLDDLRAKERDFAASEAAAGEREKQALKREGELKKAAAKLKAENANLLEKLKRASSQQNSASSKPCNHKLYPPPKKIERRVVGFLYE